MKNRKYVSCIIFFLVFIIFLNIFGSAPGVYVLNATQSMDDYDDLVYIESYDIYYADSYFYQASNVYNPHLASLSMVFANSSGPSGDPTGLDDTNWFLNQSKRLKEFFDAIGFTDFDTNEDYKKACDFDTIGVGAAKKELKDGYTLIAITPRSSGYYREWANNMFLGTGQNSDYMHEGWYNAANKLISFLDSYITNHVTTDKIKIWITGFSRGGATANIAAGLLDSKIDKKEKIFTSPVTLERKDIFAYTFEAPQGANINSKTVKKPHDAIYNNIFNIINPNDLVPKVAMYQYGFTRFGIDKYMKTEFYDPANYDTDFKTYLSLLREITSDANSLSPDTFAMYGLPIDFIARGLANKFANGNFTALQRDTTKSGYDANITATLVLEEVTKNIGSRADYTKAIQPALKNALLQIMNYNYKFSTDQIAKSLPGLISGFLFAGIYYSITGSYEMVDIIVDTIDAGIEIPNSLFKEALKALIPVLSPVFKTYWKRPNELISCVKYIDNIFQNHDTSVTLSRVRAQDSFYIDAYNEKHPGQEIELISFMDNADYGRMIFNGFNDMALYVGSERKINIDGHWAGKSDVDVCPSGYAAGYYSYATEEKMEVFFPLNQRYYVSFKDYSKKAYHTFEFIAYVQYFSLKTNGDTRKLVNHYKSWTCFNSDRYHRDLKY